MFAFKLFTLVVVCEAHEADICTPESMRADMLSLVPRLPGEDAFRLSLYIRTQTFMIFMSFILTQIPEK